MSIHALMLDGWEHTSTWGIDDGLYYAQLTRNGVSDSDGPQLWISPPRHVFRSVTELLHAIAAATGVPASIVDEAMSRGLTENHGERVAPTGTASGTVTGSAAKT